MWELSVPESQGGKSLRHKNTRARPVLVKTVTDVLKNNKTCGLIQSALDSAREPGHVWREMDLSRSGLPVSSNNPSLFSTETSGPPAAGEPPVICTCYSRATQPSAAASQKKKKKQRAASKNTHRRHAPSTKQQAFL